MRSVIVHEHAASPSRARVGRTAAGRLLGLSRSSVRRLELAGELHAEIDSNGVHSFDAAEVARVAAQRGRDTAAHVEIDEGELAARAFEAFQAGKSQSEVVITLRAEPRRVRAWYDDWRTFQRPTDVVLSSADRAALTSTLGPWRTSAELVERVARFAETRWAIAELLHIFEIPLDENGQLTDDTLNNLVNAAGEIVGPKGVAMETAQQATE